MNLHLADKAALVTGGASGIGEACVRLFADEGASIAIVDRDDKRGCALRDELSSKGLKVIFVAADLTSEAACKDAVDQTIRAFGRLDILVNNAGVNDSVPLSGSPADFLGSIQRNLFHYFALAHFAREALIASKGSIVNISSKVAETGQGGTSGYAAAKGGVNALTREWAVALAGNGVRVNCAVPAECATAQYERWFQSQPDPQASRASIERLVPLGRRLTAPEEIARMVVFLASPASSHTTGQIIHVDGGYTHLDRAASHDHPKWA
jgi:L-fucose dehydrogenase